MKSPSSWFQGFVAALLGGLGDGLLAGLGGTAVLSASAHVAVNPRAVLDVMIVNVLIDLGRYLKADSNPWGAAASGLPGPGAAPTA